ncbi:hypothetical protein [Roseovarius autotrophicus]|uniref:hypothetical protein n=1 Tax=Roseovarius autotrophicus TaxID=2824121 RepID=UPI0019F6D3B6|nr:hypothetical protein [Roseovarius autotrophicus]MBE0454206.1 hypothetical protein [Roseovarius sp.]
MTTTSHKVTAGLIFLGNRPFDMAAMVCRVGDTLERLDARVRERRCLSEELAVIRTGDLDCRLRIAGACHVARVDKTAAQRLMVTLMCEGPQPSDQRRMQAMIAHLLADLQGVLAPDFVQWTDPDAVLTRAEFCAAVTGTAALPTPPRMASNIKRKRKQLPDVESAYAALCEHMPENTIPGDDQSRLDALRAAFREPDPAPEPHEETASVREPTAPLRLAVWMMTITLGLFALPAAAALVVFNLLRGENLRLTSQVSALTGFFMVLSTTGQIAQAAELVQSLVP